MKHEDIGVASRESVMTAAAGKRIETVLIVDDHPLICQALVMTMTHELGLQKVRVAASLSDAIAALKVDGPPDAIVLDLKLPDVEGVEGLLALRQKAPDVPITVLSAELESRMVTAVLAAGACGYITKTMPQSEMMEAFRRMWRGETVLPDDYDPCSDEEDEALALARCFATLTPQQMNILRLICQGRPNKIISYELSIAEATVKTHIAAIMTKVNVRNRTHAALLAAKARLFTT
ncbi:response regulator [Loktanella sp. M215]|uniref:response regulator n=1 Tax=Loktanella sp. M215 TaxID=2675431 RepID=UPI003FA56FAE